MGVSHTHKDYDRMVSLWKRCRDAVAGQSAIHKAGKDYLPELNGETPTEYKARLCRSDFFNASWRTVSGLTGMAFRKPPTTDLPGALESFVPDINMAGVNLDAFAEMIVEEVLEVGRIGILVDHPPKPENVSVISQAAWEQLGLRPSLQLYPAETIRNWKFSRVNNAWKLVQVVLGEIASVPKDEFEDEDEQRYRVLDLDDNGFYRQRVYKVEKDEDVLIEGPIYPEMSGRPLSYIPFLIIGRSGKGDAIDEPPLIDLIDANIAHYQVNSDYRHGLHFTGLPTLFLAGIQQEEGAAPFYIGGQAAIISPHPEARGEYIEYTGQGLQAVEKALTGLERRMAVLGARMIADESERAETATATNAKRSGENSILARIVTGVSEAIEEALKIMAEWAGASGDVSYQINRDFLPVSLTPEQLNAYLAAVQAGKMSHAEYYALLQRGDVIDPAKPFDDHTEEVDAEPLPRPEPVKREAA